MRLAAGAAAAVFALVWWGAGAATAAGGGVAAPGHPSMHDSPTPSPTPTPGHSGHSGHSGHDMSGMTEDEMAGMDHGEGHEDPGGHDQHGSTPDTVSSGTRAAVLGGFAAVNAGVLAGALVLRRHDRLHPRHATRPGRLDR